MGFLARIADSFRTASPVPPTNLARVDPRRLAVRGAFDPDRVPDWFANRAADWSPWDDRAVLADAIGKCTVVFACATFLADAVAESPLEVYRKDAQGEPDVATDRPAQLCRDLLSVPNPYTSGSEFLLTLVLGMCVWGYGVVEKVRPKGALDLPVELWTLRPDWLIRRRRPDATERTWEYPKPGGGRRTIDDRDVVIVPYYPDPWRASYGISPAQVAAREIGIDSSLTDFLKTFLEHNGVPQVILKHPDPIYDPAIVAGIKEGWRQTYAGPKAYGQVGVIHGGYELEVVGDGIEAMAWPDLRGLTEQKIAQAHRVPLELIQGQMALDGSALTTTQFEGAMAVLQRYAAAPLRSRIDGAFTRGVLAEFTGGDPAYDLAFDTGGILALQEDHDALHARVRADYAAGLVTLDEARQDLGMDELPDGQGRVFAVAFSTTLTPVDDLIPAEESATPPPAETPPAKSARRYRDEKAMSPADLETRASSLARTAHDKKRLAEIGARALRKFWTEQGDRIVREVTGKGDAPDARAVHDIDWSEEERALALVLLRFYRANGEAAFAAVSDLVGVEVAWDLANPNVQRVSADLARRIVAIAETTRADVARIVGEALREGVSTPELADRLRGLFAQTYRGRAETVARTESAAAYNRASTVGYRESGAVEEVELADNPAHDADPMGPTMTTCADRAGLVVPLAEADDYTASMHPNCIMGIVPILATPLGG